MTNNTSRTGVILAAGFGSRLKGTVEDTDLKPLTPVAGTPLIFRVIQSLNKAGCSRIVIILGHGCDEIRNDIEQRYHGPNELVFVFNEQYHLKNGVSLLSAEDHIEGEFVLIMADHIVSKSVMEKAKNHHPPENGATLLVDYKINTIFDMDDATKVLAKDNRVLAIGKDIEEFNCIDTGVFVCTSAILRELREVYNERGDASISEGVSRLAAKSKMEVLDIGDGFWQDVDNAEMMKHAEEILREKDSVSL